MDHALHALNRFGLGARTGERRGLADPRAWVLAQHDRTPPIPGGTAITDVSAGLRELRSAQSSSDRQAAARARRNVITMAAAEMDGVLTHRLTTDAPVVERLVSNHLCISTSANIRVAALAGAYEREAIRPHVLGRFEDMVLASATHPAMLVYLDNAQSIGPASRAARAQQRRRTGARRGLNENYARELLEVHTLGVDGGYTQQDVQELARILTGWTVSGLTGADRSPGDGPPGDGSLRHVFDPQLHEPGSKVVLGVRYQEAGAEEGRRVIRALCRHPSTAQFVARKLVTHFVYDAPPAAVEAVARAFADSARSMTTASSPCCMRWRFPIAHAATSTDRRSSRPGSTDRSARRTAG